MDNFKDYLKEKQLAPGSVKIYCDGIKEFLEWIGKHHYTIENIRYADLMRYMKHSERKGNNKARMQRKFLALRHYFNYMIKLKNVESNPARGVYVRGVPRRLPHNLVDYDELLKLYESYEVKSVRDQRDKVILGLLIFQGITIEELETIEEQHIFLREGKIKIPATDRTNDRLLKLEASQVIELQEYLTKTRNRILYGPSVNEPEKIRQMIIGMEGGTNLAGDVGLVMKRLQHCKVTTASQIRASVVAQWTRIHDVRIVQYMSGHKYVSTTERYQATHLEDLKEQMRIYHPLN
jgi:integrase/recombinase XerD